MSKKYTENIKLIAIRNKLFSRLNTKKSVNIFEAFKITSGDYLPKSKMQSGNYIVYGGGGKTNNIHSGKNINYETVGIGRVGARCGCVFKIEVNSWVTDNALYIKDFLIDYELDFIIHFLNYKNLNQYANTSAQPVISLKRISNINLPIISKEKQVEIIDILNKIENGEVKIENNIYGVNSLLTRIDTNEKISEELTQQLNLLKKLRQAFLREAMQGKLTADWREQNPNVEPAKELLAKIKAEKEQLIKEKKIRKPKPLPPITKEEIPFEIPENWVWCRLGEILTDIKYGTSQKCNYDKSQNSPVLRIPNISGNRIDINDMKFTDLSEKDISILALKEGDILTIRSNGSRDLVGKTVIVDKAVEGYAYAGYLVRLRFNMSFLFARYIWTVTTTPFFRDLIEKPLRTTVGINNINSTEISQLLLPIPPLSEQKSIVAKLDKLMSYCDSLEESIKNSQNQNEMLLQQVLREALEAK